MENETYYTFGQASTFNEGDGFGDGYGFGRSYFAFEADNDSGSGKGWAEGHDRGW